MSGDLLDEQEFYELMQAYRWSPPTMPAHTVASFEAVKDYIREKCAVPQVVETGTEPATGTAE